MRAPMIRPGRAGAALTREPGHGRDRHPGTWADRDADRAVTELYSRHYRSLVRLAALLVPDLESAEEIVQDSFADVHSAWPERPDADAALDYLRRSVVSRSRSVPWRPGPRASVPAPGSAFDTALRALPARQREILVLRYFAELTETQIASVTGMSEGAVRSQAAQAMSALRAELQGAGPG
jgi:DNA-directed RNA polymerase specialized sigma24 family protein